jgi:quercetin dioxygenase-like cupin family protein
VCVEEAPVKQESRETITVGQVAVRFLVEAADSNGTATVFECLVPANAKVPVAHSHDAFEETVYGLEGVTTYTVNGQAVEIGPGDAFCIPRAAIHGFANHGSADAKFLAIATPGVFGPAYFREIGEVIAAAAGGPPDLGALKQVMLRHGLTPAPPVTA